MDKFIIKTFGINKVNFWGWVFSGLLIMAGAVVAGSLAIGYMIINGFEIQSLLLLGILWVLFGQFCLSAQSYLSKMAEKLEQQKK
jgi:TRAP-type mannitol/chloroaromatic compound transport system permease small subunit